MTAAITDITRTHSSSSQAALPKLAAHISNDPQLIRDFFRSKGEFVEILGTESYLKASRESYPIPWLIRECGQNPADRNPAPNQGTINGIDYQEKINPDGTTSIILTCPWQFSDIAGAIMNHSDKSEVVGQEVVGGNGVGMKQAAVRFARDLEVDFKIHGGDDSGGWIVAYKILAADPFNQMLTEAGRSEDAISRGYFIAGITESSPTKCCKYVFTTKNQEVIDSLRGLNEIMVCDHNPYLQNPDFKNEHGIIKWKLPERDKVDLQEGRLFINGQVFGFKEKGNSNSDYWKGPEGVTVQLNNIKYPKTMDRPPVSSANFETYLQTLLRSLSIDEVVEQFKKSEPIWTTQESKGSYDYARPGWQIVVEGLVKAIQYSYAENASFKAYKETWEQRKFLAKYSSLSDRQIEELKMRGYHLCPGFFARLGMADARSYLSEVDKEKKVARIDSASLRSLASDVGIPVATRNIEADSPLRLMAWFKRELEPNIESIQSRDDGVVRIYFKELNIKQDVLGAMLFDPKGKEQTALHTIRSFLLKGLSEGYPTWFSDEDVDAPISVFSGMRTTYSAFSDRAQGQQLSIVNDEVHGQANYLEFKLSKGELSKISEICNVPPLAPEARNIKVSTQVLDQLTSAKELFEWIHSKLNAFIDSVHLSSDGVLLIDFKNLKFETSDSSSQLYRPRSEEHLALYAIRSFIAAGLSNGYPPLLSNEEPPRTVLAGTNTTYALDFEDQLNISVCNTREAGTYLRLKIEASEFDSARKFAAKFGNRINFKKSEIDRPLAKEVVEPATSNGSKFAWWAGASGVLASAMAYVFLTPDPSHAIADNKETKMDARPPAAVVKINDKQSLTATRSVNPTSAEYLRWKQRVDASSIEKPKDFGPPGTSVDELITNRDRRDLINIPDKDDHSTGVEKDPTFIKLNEAAQKAIKALNEFSPNGDSIKDFKIVNSPSKEQNRKLALLSEYLSLVSGVEIPNQLFVFQGAGAYGVNFEKKAIGIHEELLKPFTPFHRALETFIHEVAHNVSGQGHGLEWMAAQSTLYADSEQKVFQILSKQRNRELLNERELRILELRDSWRIRNK